MGFFQMHFLPIRPSKRPPNSRRTRSSAGNATGHRAQWVGGLRGYDVGWRHHRPQKYRGCRGYEVQGVRGVALGDFVPPTCLTGQLVVGGVGARGWHGWVDSGCPGGSRNCSRSALLRGRYLRDKSLFPCAQHGTTTLKGWASYNHSCQPLSSRRRRQPVVAGLNPKRSASHHLPQEPFSPPPQQLPSTPRRCSR